MIVNVAGAGAGKTTKMADIIMAHDIPDGKVVFCIAFTNAAADNIKEKVAEKVNGVPDNIKISTIHSFLYKELIEPYYCFLYGKHFGQLSTSSLPPSNCYRSKKLFELEQEGSLHITKIPEKAKWVVYQKSKDTKEVKSVRKKVLSYFNSYCSAIYVDEAQDISKDIYDVLSALERAGVEIILYGDPKQDVKGFGYFRQIIDKSSDVHYFSDCYRCPQIHLNLSNTLAQKDEKQVANCENAVGSLEIVFESDIDDVKEYIETENYGLCYISQKRGEFYTHSSETIDECFETLRHEVFRAMQEKWREETTEIEIERAAYFVAEKMLENYDQTGNPAVSILQWAKNNAFDRLSRQKYAQMASAFSMKKAEPTNVVIVKSIEIIKGLEASRCLFILTSDLAPYLFRTKTDDNKMSHLLYVALTRSKDHLTILISQDVESAFSRDYILAFFAQYSTSVRKIQ